MVYFYALVEISYLGMTFDGAVEIINSNRVKEYIETHVETMIVCSPRIDHEWVSSLVSETTRIVGIESSSFDRETNDISIRLDEMNVKLMILVYKTHLRILITTSNWTRFEFEKYQSFLYYQDFKKTGAVVSSQFSCSLLSLLKDLGVSLDIITELEFCDYSNAIGNCIISKPGIYQTQYGLHALTKLIDEMMIPRDDLYAFYHTTSLHQLDQKWYDIMQKIVTADTDSPFYELYPSLSTIKQCNIDQNEAEILESNIKRWKEKKYYQKGIKDVVPKERKLINANVLVCSILNCDTAIKFGGAIADGYMLFGSHKNNRSSWGKPSTDALAIKSWELSIILPIFKSEDSNGFQLPFSIRDYKPNDEPYDPKAHGSKIRKRNEKQMPWEMERTALLFCSICSQSVVRESSNFCPHGHPVHRKCLDMAFINPSMTNCPKCVKKVSKQPNRIDAVSKFDMAVFQALLLKLETCVFNEKLRKEFKLWKPVKEEVPTEPMQIFKDHSPVQVFGYLYHYPELAHLRDEQGCQPIHWAASLGRYQVCLLLVRFGAKLDYQDLSGDVALHKAVQFGHLDIAQMLYYMLPRAATIQNSNGQTPFQVAIEKGHQSIAEFLSSKSIKRNY